MPCRVRQELMQCRAEEDLSLMNIFARVPLHGTQNGTLSAIYYGSEAQAALNVN